MAKWRLFSEKHNTPEDKLADHFKENLINHLKKAKIERGKNENHPSSLLSEGLTTIGQLSRIFDHFEFAVPDYEHIARQVGKVGRRNYAQSLLDSMLPALLDTSGTKLNKEVIDAINNVGIRFNPSVPNLYGTYREKYPEEAIANQFAKAIILGFTQHVLDAEKEKSILKMHSEMEPLENQLKDDVDAIVSKVLPEDVEKKQLSKLRVTYQETIKKLEDDHRKRQTKLNETFHTPMGEIAAQTSARGIKGTIDIKTIEEAQEFIHAFDAIVASAQSKGIVIPGIEKAQNSLTTARDIINDPALYEHTSLSVKVTQINQGLRTAIKEIVNSMTDKLMIEIPKPQEVSLWLKLLNLICSIQAVAEYDRDIAIYEKQEQLLKTLHECYDEKIDVTIKDNGQDIRVLGCESQLEKDKFLKELNKEGKIKYSIGEDGVLKRVEAVQPAIKNDGDLMKQQGVPATTPSDADDTDDLKDRLKAMSQHEGSRFKVNIDEIQQLEPPRGPGP